MRPDENFSVCIRNDSRCADDDVSTVLGVGVVSELYQMLYIVPLIFLSAPPSLTLDLPNHIRSSETEPLSKRGIVSRVVTCRICMHTFKCEVITIRGTFLEMVVEL